MSDVETQNSWQQRIWTGLLQMMTEKLHSLDGSLLQHSRKPNLLKGSDR